jgi:hypothetical protein
MASAWLIKKGLRGMSELAMIVPIFLWNLDQVQLPHQLTITCLYSIQLQVLSKVHQQKGTMHLLLCQQKHYLQGPLVVGPRREGWTFLLCTEAAQVLLLPQLSMLLQMLQYLPMVSMLLLEPFMVKPFLATRIHHLQLPLAQEHFPMMQSFRAIHLLHLHL